jgi:hypothetical protein
MKKGRFLFFQVILTGISGLPTIISPGFSLKTHEQFIYGKFFNIYDNLISLQDRDIFLFMHDFSNRGKQLKAMGIQKIAVVGRSGFYYIPAGRVKELDMSGKGIRLLED